MGKYFTKELLFTKELIENYIALHDLQGDNAVKQCLDELNILLDHSWPIFLDRTGKQLVKALIDFSENPEYYVEGKRSLPPLFIPLEALYGYLIKQLNLFFRNELNGFDDLEEYHQEAKDEEKAFLITLSSLIISHHHENVKNHPQPGVILQYYNEQIYDLVDNKKLLKKLEKKIKKDFIDHLSSSIGYLKIKSLASNPTENALIIEPDAIMKLKIFDGILWDAELNEEDFISFWRLGKKLRYLPIKKGMTSAFLFLLFSYHKSSATHAELECAFNLKDIKGKKSKINSNSLMCRNIKSIFGQPKFALKQQKG